MKNLLFLFALVSSCFIKSFALTPEAPASVYDHMTEVNRQWIRQTPEPALLQSTSFINDQIRIRMHLQLVEERLRNVYYTDFDASQQASRLRHLDVLNKYRQLGQFPTNHYHTVRQPYFRDNHGVLCAVGYLLWQDGQHDLVQRIREENNYGYLFDLAEIYPEIKHWARKNGFTLAELAWIQPTYPPIRPNFSNWGTGEGLNPGGRINVMAKSPDETKLIVAGKFSSIDGIPLNNIAVWDGASWAPLGAGVDGEVFALDYSKNPLLDKILVGGSFSLPGQADKQNIAEYDFQTVSWQGLQSGNMEGTVFAVHYNTGFPGLYIGGDFKKVNGTEHPFISHWHPYNGGVWNYYYDFLHTDGPVKSFTDIDGLVAVGGSFEKVIDKNSQDWIPAPHLVYLNHSAGWITLPHNLPEVNALAYFEGNVFAAHPIKIISNYEVEGLSVLKAGIWHSIGVSPFADSTIHGFAAYGNSLLVYGSFWAGSGWGGVGSGMAFLPDDDLKIGGVLLADSTVRAAIEFQGQVHVAGDFKDLYSYHNYTTAPFNGLARFTAAYVSSPEPDQNLSIKVIATANQLRLQHENLEHKTQLRIFDLQGHLLSETTLDQGSVETALDAPSNWASGIYVYQLQNETGLQAGKWAVQR